jgi:ferredoxin
MYVRIDTNQCEGHGRCYLLVPTVFSADNEGHGVVVVGELKTSDQVAEAELAVRNCPESAITLSEVPPAT